MRSELLAENVERLYHAITNILRSSQFVLNRSVNPSGSVRDIVRCHIVVCSTRVSFYNRKYTNIP